MRVCSVWALVLVVSGQQKCKHTDFPLRLHRIQLPRPGLAVLCQMPPPGLVAMQLAGGSSGCRVVFR